MNPLEELQQMLVVAKKGGHVSPHPVRVHPDDLEGLDPRLHDYQRVAVAHLRSNPRAGLFLDMGLGKTASSLQALTPKHLPALVIAPKRVTEEVWPREVPKWRPDLSIALAAGSRDKRLAALASGADIVAIGRDNIRDVEIGQFRTIIIDELSSFKNQGTNRFKIGKALCANAAYVWGLTGTPAPNGYMDLWAPMYLLDQGKRLETTITKYRTRYFTPGKIIQPQGVVARWDLVPGSKERIERAISDICLAQQAIDHLRDVSHRPLFNDVTITLPPKAARAYETMAKTLVAQIEEDRRSAPNAAAMSSKLSQIAAGFLYPDREMGEVVEGQELIEFHDLKTEAVNEVVEETGSPVLVFYRFIQEKQRLLKALPQARTIDQRNVVHEWNQGRVPVLLAHPASAGHGLNLQDGGHTIVWSTPTWSPEEYAQGNARLARQGQKHQVIIHHIIGAPVDTAAVARVQGKISEEQALMVALKGDR